MVAGGEESDIARDTQASSLFDCAGHAGAKAGQPPAAQGLVIPPDDGLTRRLLEEFGVPSKSLSDQVDVPLADLKAVLAADYLAAPGFPPGGLAHELSKMVEDIVRPYRQIWKCWQDRQSLHRLRRVFAWGDIVVNAQPYMRGTGLSLWGFSCEVKVRGHRKFVIFLNTAHDSGAVAAAIGHELGHYLYNSVGAAGCAEQAAMGTMFAQHLLHEQELFSDSVVALSAYSRPAVRKILGDARAGAGSPDAMFDQIHQALAAVDPHYRIDLSRGGLTAPWRIRYLTLMIHFFKLRSALFEAAGV